MKGNEMRIHAEKRGIFRKTGKLLLAALLLFTMLWGCTLPVLAGNGKGNTEPEELHTDSPLYEKTALFCGDSICAAAVYDYSNMTRWGWSGRIARDYGMKCENRGADGASVSNVRESNTIFAQLQGASKPNYDFIILHGGTNDGWDKAPVGEITPEDNRSKFDTGSFAGGLEQLFAYAKRVYPQAKIGYIINFQTPSSIGTLNDMSAYYEEAKKICEKWEIPYLDLYNDEHFNQKVMQVKSGRFTVDKIHPNGKGYDKIYPYVAAFMEKMAMEEELPSGGSDAASDVTSDITSAAASDAASESAGGDAAKKDSSGNSSAKTVIVIVFAAVCIVCAGAAVGIFARKKKR